MRSGAASSRRAAVQIIQPLGLKQSLVKVLTQGAITFPDS